MTRQTCCGPSPVVCPARYIKQTVTGCYYRGTRIWNMRSCAMRARCAAAINLVFIAAAHRARIAQLRIFHIRVPLLFIPTKSWFREKSISRMRDSEELSEWHYCTYDRQKIMDVASLYTHRESRSIKTAIFIESEEFQRPRGRVFFENLRKPARDRRARAMH